MTDTQGESRDGLTGRWPLALLILIVVAVQAAEWGGFGAPGGAAAVIACVALTSLAHRGRWRVRGVGIAMAHFAALVVRALAASPPDAEDAVRQGVALALAPALGFALRRRRDALGADAGGATGAIPDDRAAHLLAEYSSDLITTHAPDGAYLYASPASLRILGYHPAELVGRNPYELIHPDDVPDIRPGHEHLLARATTQAFAFRMRRKSGEYVWIESTCQSFTDAAGATFEIISIARDVTDRKQEEARAQRVSRELAHRVRNSLAAVRVVCQETLRRSASLEEFRGSFDDRLAALSHAQDMLLAEPRAALTPTELARASVSALAPDPARLRLSGHDATRVKARAAGVLHMVLHELATNALKHGALSAPEGRIEIDWRDDERGGIRLTWRERAGPPVTPPTRKGFGGELITGSVRYELQGEVDWRFEPGGVVCEVSIPEVWLERSVAPASA